MGSLALLFLITVLLSFLCSLMESVLLSTTAAYVGVLVKENRQSGRLLNHLKSNIQRPLSAILTLNTVSNTLGSAAIAYQAQHIYGDEAVTVTSFALTLMILLLAEILPKSLGASNWKALAPFSAYIIQFMVIILYPFVFLFEKFGRTISSRNDDEPELTREEVMMTAEIGAEEGAIHNKEHHIIKNLLMLDKIFVSDIMTPRSVVFALDENQTVGEIFAKYKPLRFSRIPVYHGDIDHISGVTYRFKIHDAVSQDDHHRKIKDLLTPISTISEHMTVQQLIDYFIKEKEHISLVIDEYGVVTGIVTLEDAVETLLGVEIVDELDSVEDMRKYALEQWQQHRQKLRRT